MRRFRTPLILVLCSCLAVACEAAAPILFGAPEPDPTTGPTSPATPSKPAAATTGPADACDPTTGTTGTTGDETTTG